jgi:hypothetical protein
MRDFKREQNSFEEGVERTLDLVNELDRDDVDFGPAVSACLSVLIFEVLKHTRDKDMASDILLTLVERTLNPEWVTENKPQAKSKTMH